MDVDELKPDHVWQIAALRFPPRHIADDKGAIGLIRIRCLDRCNTVQHIVNAHLFFFFCYKKCS